MLTRKALLLGIVLLAIVAAAGLFIARAVATRSVEPSKAAPSVPVSVAPVLRKAVPFRLTAIGNVEPYATVALKALVDGQIVSVHFTDGQAVKKGELLFEIDPRPYQASLEQAQATLAKDKALLARATEQQKRNQDLLQKNFISPDAYHQVKTNTQTAAAVVDADEAAVESARLLLQHCSIHSPIDGYAGKIMIQAGNLVKANDANALVVINQVAPIKASFSVPEQYVGEIRNAQAKGELPVQANLAGLAAPATGKLVFVDNAADSATGTIRLEAQFPNDDTRLWPGQFVEVALTLHVQQDAVVVPSIAIQNGPNGQYVFVLLQDSTVELRAVKVDGAEGDETVIASGVEPGDQVVTAGQLRLAPGTRVTLAAAEKAL